jgi:hypothetical protein
MQYWLNLFTGTTWDESRSAGLNVSGFRASQRKKLDQIKPGDIFLCYVTGVQRWVGALEILGPSENKSTIWSVDEFPVRFAVKPLIVLEPECGIPMKHLEGKVSFYEGPEHKGMFKGFVRTSPNLFKVPEDAELIFGLIKQAEASPVERPVDPKKLARKPTYKVKRKRGRKTIQAVVSVPEREEDEPVETDAPIEAKPVEKYSTRHTEIQQELVRLGAEMGLDIWIARNDRSKVWDGVPLGDLPNVLDDLPVNLDDATKSTIELIDVLWIKRNSIVAAFEIECTTSIYSGLLRMSDLISLQPNLDIKLYIVAPDERRTKVSNEIVRPTFALLEKPLPQICGFLSFTVLMEKVNGIRKLGVGSSLNPDFLGKIAEYFGDED